MAAGFALHQQTLYLTPALVVLQAPGLAVVLVGERKDSQTYVRSKKKACEECGIKSFGTDLPETATGVCVINTSASRTLTSLRHGDETPGDHPLAGAISRANIPKPPRASTNGLN